MKQSRWLVSLTAVLEIDPEKVWLGFTRVDKSVPALGPDKVPSVQREIKKLVRKVDELNAKLPTLDEPLHLRIADPLFRPAGTEGPPSVARALSRYRSQMLDVFVCAAVSLDAAFGIVGCFGQFHQMVHDG